MDYALFPWAHRLPVFEHYRGESFAIPAATPGLRAYHAWLAAMEALPLVAKTCPPWDDYLQHIGRYADGSARSKVANAVGGRLRFFFVSFLFYDRLKKYIKVSQTLLS